MLGQLERCYPCLEHHRASLTAAPNCRLVFLPIPKACDTHTAMFVMAVSLLSGLISLLVTFLLLWPKYLTETTLKAIFWLMVSEGTVFCRGEGTEEAWEKEREADTCSHAVRVQAGARATRLLLFISLMIFQHLLTTYIRADAMRFRILLLMNIISRHKIFFTFSFYVQ